MKRSVIIFLLSSTFSFVNAQTLKPAYLMQPDFLYPLLHGSNKLETSAVSNVGVTKWFNQDMFSWKLVTIYLDSIKDGNFIQYVSTGYKKWVEVEYSNNKIVSYGELISQTKSDLPNDTIMVTYSDPPYPERPEIHLWQKTIKNGNWVYYSKETEIFEREEIYKDGILLSKRN